MEIQILHHAKIYNLKLEMEGNLTSEVGWMEEFDMWSWMEGGV
jgi:hypothetical protein